MTPAERSKLYRQQNPEKWRATTIAYQKRKYTCECGCVISNQVRTRHKKTKNHIERMSLLMSNPPNSDIVAQNNINTNSNNHTVAV